MKTWLWQTLMRMADRCEKSSDYFKGAANRLVPERALTLVDCEAQGWQNVRPCFVLSTGRSGTMFLNQLLISIAHLKILPDHTAWKTTQYFPDL